jgi:hypothetical protein
MVSFEFFIDIILLEAQWLWDGLSLISTGNISWREGKGSWWLWLTTLPPSTEMKSGRLNLLEPLGPVQGLL